MRQKGLPLTGGEVAFFLELQEALASEEWDWIASRVSYPIEIQTLTNSILVSSRGQILENPRRIFGEQISCRILKSRPGELFKNWRGVSVGSGLLWYVETQKLGGEGFEYFIIAINN